MVTAPSKMVTTLVDTLRSDEIGIHLRHTLSAVAIAMSLAIVGGFVIGFILLDLAHFGYPGLTVVAGYELMVCALAAWYMMARAILNEIYGKEVLPAGKPWVS